MEQRHALNECVPNADEFDLHALARIGAWGDEQGEALHILVAKRSARRFRAPLSCHVQSKPLPRGALRKIDAETYCVAPAFAVLQYSYGRTFAQVLTLIMELLGTYTLAPEATLPLSRDEVVSRQSEWDLWGGTSYRCEPAVTQAELRAVARWAQGSESLTFRQAVSRAVPGSASPAETLMFGMLGLPMSYGGFGLNNLSSGGMQLNFRIDFDERSMRMASGIPYAICDAYIASARVDLEYDGNDHDRFINKIHDDKRNNGMQGMGIKVIAITRSQMREVDALEAIAQMIYKEARTRFRYYIKGYRPRQTALLNDLRHASGLPPS